MVIKEDLDRFFKFVFVKKNIEKTILTILLSATAVLFSRNLQDYLLNPLVNRVIMYEEKDLQATDVNYTQILRSIVLICIYLIFIYISTLLANKFL